MYHNIPENTSLLGLSFNRQAHLNAPPGLPHPSSRLSHAPPGLNNYNSLNNSYQSPENNQRLSSYELSYNDELLINNELSRMSQVFENLLTQRKDIDYNLTVVQSRIDELIKKKEYNKTVLNMSHGGGGGNIIYPTQFKQPIEQSAIPLVQNVKEHIKEPIREQIKNTSEFEVTENFIKSVQDILRKYPNIVAREIQNKLSPENRPPAGSRKFQQFLCKVPGVMTKEIKFTTRTGTDMIDNIFYLDPTITPTKESPVDTFDGWVTMKFASESKTPIPSPFRSLSNEIKTPIKFGNNWSTSALKMKNKACYRQLKGKPCKLNEKGFCNYCK